MWKPCLSQIQIFFEKGMRDEAKGKQQLHTHFLHVAFENMPHPEMRLRLCVPWS